MSTKTEFQEGGEVFITIPYVPLEEQEKYVGKYVAVLDGKVIAAGYSSLEVYQKVDSLFPDEKPEDLIYDYVPREEMLIL